VSIDIVDLMDGVQLEVSHAQSGAWFAYVSLPNGWRNYMEGGPHGVRPRRNGGNGFWWDDIAGDTEAEAREKGCDVVGYVFGRRLAEAMGPHDPLPQPPPTAAQRSVTL
jgi:hypothetical protein